MLYIEKTDLVRGTLGASGSCPFTVRITAGRSKKLFDHLRVCLTVPLPKIVIYVKLLHLHLLSTDLL